MARNSGYGSISVVSCDNRVCGSWRKCCKLQNTACHWMPWDNTHDWYQTFSLYWHLWLQQNHFQSTWGVLPKTGQKTAHQQITVRPGSLSAADFETTNWACTSSCSMTTTTALPLVPPRCQWCGSVSWTRISAWKMADEICWKSLVFLAARNTVNKDNLLYCLNLQLHTAQCVFFYIVYTDEHIRMWCVSLLYLWNSIT